MLHTCGPLIPVPAHPVKEGRVDVWERPGATAPTPHVEALQRAGALEAMLFEACVRRAAER